MLIEYLPPTTPYLDILYQDEALVVFNKPSGLLTVPGKAAEHKDSLEYRAKLVWPGIRVVHRLDMATSGIVIMALTADSQRELNRQFQQRSTKKHYIACVAGSIGADVGTIDLPLICDWPNRPKQMVNYQYGKDSLTHYQVLERS
ncbi:MAG TPA: pseudouridine synthase, partial [Rheinheimera sp.]|nr:pseudouridine synthase [Rheinheimera sp.]